MRGIEDGGDMKNEDTEQYSKQRKCDITVNKYVCMYRCMYVPMYNVCMYVCIYVYCMYVFMYVYMYLCIMYMHWRN